MRCNVRIDRFARTGDALLFFYSYECFVGERLLLSMNSGAGFFSQEELEAAKGLPTAERNRLDTQKQHFEPLLRCAKTAFDETDLAHLSSGNLAGCFGETYRQDGLNPSLRLPPEGLRMIDRVTSVEPTGGSWGLGLVVGEKDLDPEQWYFNCHFKDDLCIPGTLLGEGCSQLLQFCLLHLGLQTSTIDARFQPIADHQMAGYSRGQITPTSGTVTYRLEVSKIGLTPRPYAIADIDIMFGGRVIASCTDVGIQLSEKDRIT